MDMKTRPNKAKHVDSQTHDPIFVMDGDFNVVLDPRDASYPNASSRKGIFLDH